MFLMVLECTCLKVGKYMMVFWLMELNKEKAFTIMRMEGNFMMDSGYETKRMELEFSIVKNNTMRVSGRKAKNTGTVISLIR